MLNRAFFSLQSPWTPTAVALGNLVLNTLLYYVFYRVGTWGIPLAISLANVAGVAALLLLLRRRLGRIDFGQISSSVARVTLAAAVLAGVSYGGFAALEGSLPLAVALVSALVAGAAAYAVSARLLGVRELDALLALRRRPGG
jgi:putative peptidoglycan lipid II flippase